MMSRSASTTKVSTGVDGGGAGCGTAFVFTTAFFFSGRYCASRYWRRLLSNPDPWTALHYTLPPSQWGRNQDNPTYGDPLLGLSVLAPSALPNVRTLGLHAPAFDPVFTHQRFNNDAMPRVWSIFAHLASTASARPHPLRNLRLSGVFLAPPERDLASLFPFAGRFVFAFIRAARVGDAQR